MGNVKEAKRRIVEQKGSPFYSLDLVGLGLTVEDLKELFPIIQKELPNLETFLLGDNQLTSLPKEIGRLRQLKLFDLSRNQLRSLPEEIGELRQLELFDLSRNQLRSLPDEIGNLRDLQYLMLNNNQLTSLLFSLGDLDHLKELDLSDNRLTSLPDEICGLTHLEYLYVSFNLLEYLPERINTLEGIRKLFADNNPLSDAAKELLRELDDNRGVSVDFDMESYTNDNDYKEVVRKIYGSDEEKANDIIRRIALLDQGEYKVDDTDETGAYVLTEFLARAPQNEGVYQSIYDKAITDLLNKSLIDDDIKNKETTIALIATCLGNCNTPVKSFIIQNAIALEFAPGKNKPNSQMDQLIAREALENNARKIYEREKGPIIEQIEIIEALVNSVHLEGAEKMPKNKLKIVGKRDRSPSKSQFIDIGFCSVPEAMATAFAPICCKTDADGKLIEEHKGYGVYHIDPKKLESLKEEYYKDIGVVSEKEKLIAKFTSDLQGVLKEEKYSDLVNSCFDQQEVNKYIDVNAQAEALRAELLFADNQEEVCNHRFREVRKKLEELSLKYPEQTLETNVITKKKPVPKIGMDSKNKRKEQGELQKKYKVRR